MKNLLRLILLGSGLLALFSTHAAVVEKAIPYTHEGEQFEGFLYYDDAVDGKRPGVLVVHEWWGLNDYAKRRARMLAELGYAAFAVDMYGKGKVTDSRDQARNWMQEVTADIEDWRARAARGVEILRSQSMVDAAKTAAIGYCFGGGTMLQMAYAGTDLKGVVSFHGSLPAPDSEDLKRIRTRILILHGSMDGFVPAELIAKTQRSLDLGGVDWHMVYYGNSVHGFTSTEADARGMNGLGYNAKADARSWAHMQRFFDEIFAD